jgi:hypothetical protein
LASGGRLIGASICGVGSTAGATPVLMDVINNSD